METMIMPDGMKQEDLEDYLPLNDVMGIWGLGKSQTQRTVKEEEIKTGYYKKKGGTQARVCYEIGGVLGQARERKVAWPHVLKNKVPHGRVRERKEDLEQLPVDKKDDAKREAVVQHMAASVPPEMQEAFLMMMTDIGMISKKKRTSPLTYFMMCLLIATVLFFGLKGISDKLDALDVQPNVEVRVVEVEVDKKWWWESER